MRGGVVCCIVVHLLYLSILYDKKTRYIITNKLDNTLLSSLESEEAEEELVTQIDEPVHSSDESDNELS